MKRTITTAAAVAMAAMLTATAAFAAPTPAHADITSRSSLVITSSANPSAAGLSRAGVALAVGAARPDTTAAQDGLAINAFTIALTGDPNASMQTACEPPQYGAVYLAAGDYEWNLFIGAESVKTITIALESGYYTWNDCITPEDGYYVQFSILCPPNADPSTPCVQLQADDRIDSGTYWVGSWLRR